ncbi:MAG: UDP-N-acetylglucosamine 1-carboxyvinyltransferase [Clostridia bacterium]|nr:UDP-N-acetylglucosamine 1-carboxyvinyltransferase [Clostridia bacterium]
MEKLIVRPSGPLYGRVGISGSKNAALPILAAVLLCESPCIIGNLPAIRDVELALSILAGMGAQVERIDRATYRIDPTHAAPPGAPDPLSGRMRASAYYLGAGLGRFGRGCVGRIGGCDFGGRPIDQHLKAFLALGGSMEVSEEAITVQAAALRGAMIEFDTVSVGATVNAILAATRAEGETVLKNAASEPHIADLVAFLNRCGADIRGAGTSTLHIRGVKHLRGCSYAVIPDMIEAGTYLLAAAATQGAVTVCGADPHHLVPLISKLREMGAEIDCEERRISLFAAKRLRGASVITGPYPGFPTDLQPQMAALFCAAEGRGLVEERVWRQRFRYAIELQKMGAAITVRENTAYVRGTCLHGAEISVPDLRAGAALLIAACAAEGESTLSDTSYIERGYEDIIGKLRAIGADISAG